MINTASRPPLGGGTASQISAGRLIARTSALLPVGGSCLRRNGATAHGPANPELVTTADGPHRVARFAIVAKTNDGKDAHTHN